MSTPMVQRIGLADATARTVQIGDMVWMADDLDIAQWSEALGARLAQSVADWTAAEQAGVAAWCQHPELPTSRLLNSHAVRAVNALLTDGWRVPRKQDWNRLAATLGDEVAERLMMADAAWDVRPDHMPYNTTGFSSVPTGMRWGGGKVSDPFAFGPAGHPDYWHLDGESYARVLFGFDTCQRYVTVLTGDHAGFGLALRLVRDAG